MTLSERDIKKYFEDMGAFSLGQQRDVMVFIAHLGEMGYDLEYAEACIAYKEEKLIADMARDEAFLNEWMEKSLKCPNCGKAMEIIEVNTVPGNQVGGRFQTQWACPDWKDCGHEMYSRKNTYEWMKKLRIKIPGMEINK